MNAVTKASPWALAATPARPDVTAVNGASANATGGSTDGRGADADVSVALSDEAKAVLTPKSFASVGQDARAKLDADYAQAKAEGTQIVFDTSQNGRLLHIGKLSDQELAAVALNRDHLFSKDEITTAQGELGHRVQVSLAAWEGNLGEYQTGVQQLYQAMSPEVRQALGWNEDMIDMSKRLVASAEQETGKIDRKSFLQKFIEHLKAQRDAPSDRALDMDPSRFGFDDDDTPASRDGQRIETAKTVLDIAV